MSEDDGAARCASVCARFNAAPYYGLLGLHAESDAPGCARVTLAWAEKLTQVYGGVHGGALMSLADASMGIAIATLLAEGEVAVTAEISMHFLAPPDPADIVAEATVSRRGRSLAFIDTILRSPAREIARARSIFQIRPAA